jgi:hypothetical protein
VKKKFREFWVLEISEGINTMLVFSSLSGAEEFLKQHAISTPATITKVREVKK